MLYVCHSICSNFGKLKNKIDQSYSSDQCFIDLHEIGKRVFSFPESLSCDEFHACQFGACYLQATAGTNTSCRISHACM